MNDKVGIVYVKDVSYPNERNGYAPSTRYPEYMFEDVSLENNQVYSMVRDLLYGLGWDKENYGQKQWNPLGTIIHKGDFVLIKPNWVMHVNNEIIDHSMECMVTHSSILKAIIDYVVIALAGTGKIVVGDAPVQGCNFEELKKVMHLNELQQYYKNKGIFIEIADLRGRVVRQNAAKQNIILRDIENGCVVDLKDTSCFSQFDVQKLSRLRITKYPTHLLQKHHRLGKHEYSINRKVLEANVIINVPKPKAHRKAGMTACLKNMIGTCSRKEYLPHHTQGSLSEKGDEYFNKNIWKMLSSKALDKSNDIEEKNKKIAFLFKCFYKMFQILGKTKGDRYLEGSWFGNDTIWRTIVDINNIVRYADTDGKMQDEPQRVVFSIADMIIVGEKEGPLIPSPHREGLLVGGLCAEANDYVISNIFGFNVDMIKYLQYYIQQRKLRPDKIEIVSNMPKVEYKSEWKIEPAAAWKKIRI